MSTVGIASVNHRGVYLLSAGTIPLPVTKKQDARSKKKNLSYSTLPPDRYPLLHHCASP